MEYWFVEHIAPVILASQQSQVYCLLTLLIPAKDHLLPVKWFLGLSIDFWLAWMLFQYVREQGLIVQIKTQPVIYNNCITSNSHTLEKKQHYEINITSRQPCYFADFR